MNHSFVSLAQRNFNKIDKISSRLKERKKGKKKMSLFGWGVELGNFGLLHQTMEIT